MKTIESILNLLAPYECLGCGEEGSLLCKTCSLDACGHIPSRCYRCKKLTTDFAVCSSCRKVSKISNVWVRTEYTGISKDLINRLKYKSARQAATIISELISEWLPYLPADTIVAEVPTASSRRRQRGYDHAKQIAKELARIQGLSYASALSRVGQTRQVGTGRQERFKQLEGAFWVKSDVTGSSILLIDDVITTGSSIESAAKELRSAGAKKVYATVFAQK